MIRTLRSAENDLGVLPLRSIAEGKLIHQSIGRDGAPVEMKRLPPLQGSPILSTATQASAALRPGLSTFAPLALQCLALLRCELHVRPGLSTFAPLALGWAPPPSISRARAAAIGK